MSYQDLIQWRRFMDASDIDLGSLEVVCRLSSATWRCFMYPSGLIAVQLIILCHSVEGTGRTTHFEEGTWLPIVCDHYFTGISNSCDWCLWNVILHYNFDFFFSFHQSNSECASPTCKWKGMKHGKLGKAERVVVQNMRPSVRSLKNVCNFIFFRFVSCRVVSQRSNLNAKKDRLKFSFSGFRMIFIPWKRDMVVMISLLHWKMWDLSSLWWELCAACFPCICPPCNELTPSLQSFAMVPVSASWYMLYKAILRISIPVLVTSPTCCWHFFLGRINKQSSLMAWKHQQLANHATE